tara:strand:+ start:162 stop:365 length:204 start_codon:yes stop_codon:yes gene_type:complete
MITELEHLRKNVRDLQGQLRNAYLKIKDLTDEVHKLRRKVHPTKSIHSTGWVENPDASHIKENKNDT